MCNEIWQRELYIIARMARDQGDNEYQRRHVLTEYMQHKYKEHKVTK